MNKLYYKSPILIQHLLTTIYGFKLKEKDTLKIILNTLKRIKITKLMKKMN